MSVRVFLACRICHLQGRSGVRAAVVCHTCRLALCSACARTSGLVCPRCRMPWLSPPERARAIAGIVEASSSGERRRLLPLLEEAAERGLPLAAVRAAVRRGRRRRELLARAGARRLLGEGRDWVSEVLQ